MSENIYSLLLRLYPSRFREEYGEEALRLFRDRLKDERGFFPALRLWLDLLGDLWSSVPLQYRRDQPVLAGASAPSFQVIEGASPRLGALLLGGVLTLVAFGASTAIVSIANHVPFHAPSGGGSGGMKSQAPVGGVGFGARDRQRVIEEAAANLKEHLRDAAAAQKLGDSLSAHEKAGDFDAASDGAAFAAQATRHLQDESHDRRIALVYSGTPLPAGPRSPSPEAIARYRAAMDQQNCTIDKVDTLPNNVGYLKLNSFPDPSVCESKVRAAMASLNDASAIVFDLRDNRGGYPDMVTLIADYLFDHPEYLYNPREATTERSWSRPVPGSKLVDKPVYVLTSARTFSGAEHFSYDLKMLKRATLLGERTGGATDVGAFYRLDDHFGLAVPPVAINPYSEPDWAGAGVEPDVKVKAADALETAVRLVQARLEKK
jgi:hypothetical protein